MARKYKTKALLALAAASLGIGACTFPGAVASVPEREEEVAAVATAVDTIPDYSMPTAPGFPTAVPTPAYILPSLESLAVNGTALIAEDDVFTVPAEINPGDRLQVEAEVADDVGGTLSLLSASRSYTPDGGPVEFSLTVPADLSSADIPLVLEGKDGETVDYVLRITPSSEWAPTVVVESPTGLTGEVSLEVRVSDLNGPDTVQSLAVEQEFNPQATGNKRIREYISNTSLAPFTVEQTESGLYTVRFNAEWPGRFPLHFIAIDTEGNETNARVPVEVYWAEQPFEIRGMALGPYWDRNFDYEPLLDHLVENNVQYIEINPIWFMPDEHSTEIRSMPETWQSGQAGVTMSDRSLRRLIQEAQERGLNVFLKPMIEFDHFTDWRGNLQPSDWGQWFESYTDFIVHYATIAEEEGVPLFCIGAELKNSARYTSQWQEVISAVRGSYSGELTYSDSELLPGNSTVNFWGDLDFIGMPLYYPSNGTFWGSNPALVDPTTDQMVISIESNLSRIVVPLVTRYGLDVLVTETGVPNYDGASVRPWSWQPDRAFSPDYQEQADYYEAVLRVLSEKEWIRGLFWWEAVMNSSHSNGQGLADYDPWGNPAEDTIGIWYHLP